MDIMNIFERISEMDAVVNVPNAIIATLIALAVGVVICIKRHVGDVK